MFPAQSSVRHFLKLNNKKLFLWDPFLGVCMCFHSEYIEVDPTLGCMKWQHSASRKA